MICHCFGVIPCRIAIFISGFFPGFMLIEGVLRGSVWNGFLLNVSIMGAMFLVVLFVLCLIDPVLE